MMRVALVGAAGRTGRAVLVACQADREVRCVAALASGTSAHLGRDAGELAGVGAIGVPLASELACSADVLVDFSVPAACARWASLAAERGIPFVTGTTGLGEDEEAALRTAACRIAVVRSPNMAPGVNLLLRLVHRAASVLGTEHDVSVLDVHHRHKRDVPSGTALALAREVEAARGAAPPIRSLRIGGRPGDHTVHFASEDETLALSHATHDRRVFARGALLAARWVQQREPGLYDMQDVLFAD